MDEYEQLKSQAIVEITAASSIEALEAVRVAWLGKKGRVTGLLKQLGQLPTSERPRAGQAVNTLKQELAEAIESQRSRLQAQAMEKKLQEEAVDISLPGRGEVPGRCHPVIMALQRIEGLFRDAGFVIAEGPEIEDDYHNFEALNIPADHPARAMHDTFYLKEDGWLLRTHTSPVQIRHLQQQSRPPVWMIAPGRVYRRDSDVTHTPMFHQVEGLIVDENIHMGHLKWTLKAFLEAFFERDLQMRLRPSYFPFTEPSAEVDIACVICDGQGCRVCSGSGWLEVLGCGMVHPVVMSEMQVDTGRFNGFAFGMGIERLAMLRYGIRDLRRFFENDMRYMTPFV